MRRGPNAFIDELHPHLDDQVKAQAAAARANTPEEFCDCLAQIEKLSAKSGPQAAAVLSALSHRLELKMPTLQHGDIASLCHRMSAAATALAHDSKLAPEVLKVARVVVAAVPEAKARASAAPIEVRPEIVAEKKDIETQKGVLLARKAQVQQDFGDGKLNTEQQMDEALAFFTQEFPASMQTLNERFEALVAKEDQALNDAQLPARQDRLASIVAISNLVKQPHMQSMQTVDGLLSTCFVEGKPRSGKAEFAFANLPELMRLAPPGESFSKEEVSLAMDKLMDHAMNPQRGIESINVPNDHYWGQFAAQEILATLTHHGIDVTSSVNDKLMTILSLETVPQRHAREEEEARAAAAAG